MTYYDVFDRYDEGIHTNNAWRRSEYVPLCCLRCKDILPGNALGINSVDIDEMPLGYHVMLSFPVRISMLHSVLLNNLEPFLSHFHRCAIVLNTKKLDRYIGLVPLDSARVKQYGDDRSTYVMCSICGRENQRSIYSELFFYLNEIGDRDVFVNAGGAGLYLSDRAAAALSDEVLTGLVLTPIKVV